MDIRGIWKVKEVRMPTPDGEKFSHPITRRRMRDLRAPLK